jgi:hypothetical protein
MAYYQHEGPSMVAVNAAIRSLSESSSTRARRSDKQREMQRTCQQACRPILSRAPVDAITRQLSLALFMDAKLDIGQKRAGAKAPA